ncbi:hypothetical protein CH063_06409 [Colletotrichum higginsianum]|uniref:Uncharacterized protein n=1 Tax=Colletotrichum higginsianum (strain IMI 349063) TaxID=759273 RepID=H1V2G1_COLHI|nr:hypothetical protein CH063_06409 [Colletotrichum higginsianum]
MAVGGKTQSRSQHVGGLIPILECQRVQRSEGAARHNRCPSCKHKVGPVPEEGYHRSSRAELPR